MGDGNGNGRGLVLVDCCRKVAGRILWLTQLPLLLLPSQLRLLRQLLLLPLLLLLLVVVLQLVLLLLLLLRTICLPICLPTFQSMEPGSTCERGVM